MFLCEYHRKTTHTKMHSSVEAICPSEMGHEGICNLTYQKQFDIAVQVGYEDEHVFMRGFKRYAGMTPGQYRISEKDL